MMREEERANLVQAVDAMGTTITKQNERIAELEAEVGRLRAALERAARRAGACAWWQWPPRPPELGEC